MNLCKMFKSFLVLIYLGIFVNLTLVLAKDINDRPKEMTQRGSIDCMGNMKVESIKVAKSKDFTLLNLIGKSFTMSELTGHKTTVTDFSTPLLIPNNADNTLYVTIDLI
jgi:hypothetical protein